MDLPTVAVIVDGCRAGAGFSPAFREKDIPCVNIQSRDPLPIAYGASFRPDLFIENIIFRGDAASTAASLKEKYRVTCVIPGTEIGVEVADQVSEALGILSNGTKRSRARRDKYEMALALQDAKLPTPKFCKLSSWEELMKWKVAEEIDYPIVLKPLNCAGTDGVFICHDESELSTAFYKLIGSTNILNEINHQILAQSFLAGKEYLINSVSRDGELFVTAILQGEKKRVEGRGYMYVHEKILKSTGHIQDTLVAMHRKVAVALEISHGPLHAEYKLTEDGPVLIEVAARVSGGTHTTNTESTGFEQIEMTVDAYIAPALFRSRITHPYERRAHFCEMFLSAPYDGIITGKEAFEGTIRSLSSYRAHSFPLNEGESVSITADLASSIGAIFLVNPDKTALEKDYVRISKLASKLVAPLPS